MARRKTLNTALMPQSSASILAQFVDNSFPYTQTAPINPDEMSSRHTTAMGIVDRALMQYSQLMEQGAIAIKSTADLERLVRVMASLEDLERTSRAEALAEHPEDDTPVMSIDDAKQEDVEALFDRMYKDMNRTNDE